jgi:ferredoxin hydrogenase large subunit/hydrogenase large subunit
MRCAAWLDQLQPDLAGGQGYPVPQSGSGMGLMEAPRGALGHWVTIANRVIEAYQCVVTTTWNCSPRDDRGQPGAVEQALVGVPVADKDNPIEAMRVLRSFDPCLACAVH